MGLYTSFVASALFPAQEYLKRHGTVAARRKMDEVQWWPMAKVAELQLQRLKELLQDAGRHVPYYRDLFAKYLCQLTGLDCGFFRDSHPARVYIP